VIRRLARTDIDADEIQDLIQGTERAYKRFMVRSQLFSAKVTYARLGGHFDSDGPTNRECCTRYQGYEDRNQGTVRRAQSVKSPPRD
jgi:hypothetical protein